MPLGLRNIPASAAAAAAAAAAVTAAIVFFRRRPRSSSTSFSLTSSAIMEDRRPDSVLVLFVKSSQEDEIARSIKAKKETLKLFEEGEAQGEIRVLLQSEIDSIDYPTFRAEPYMDALNTNSFGRLLIWSPRLPSTHDVVSKNFCEFPVGTACITDFQYKGKGRAKNVWESPAGCLMFSFTLQMEDGRKVPLVQYIVSLAVTEAIKESCQAKGLPQIDVRIKWPNDLYLNGLKVGGILCTSTYSSNKFNVSAGVGLNLDNDKPTTSLNAAIQEITAVSHQLGREDILAAFFNNFEKLFEVFLHQGFQVLEELYCRTWLHSDQKVVIEEKQEEQVVNIAVTIKGLTSSGYLLAMDEEQRYFELHPDGNSFDFFKGLVRRKLD
ncbi:biotin--protein ligase 2 [Dendrobium catenatum]|uniref:BPL/LPL catalytic domain-containing protein n=1 Tax=Dendrobium catenatum TaxID=906689 RepID=A0A2I0W1K8_9ASPA|nr:biotin--protein ligase 2 [Dendrobium catenatum]PKU69553.1 hypothetical protein MA16_Dca024320 [Dendrobium catenatum]